MLRIEFEQPKQQICAKCGGETTTLTRFVYDDEDVHVGWKLRAARRAAVVVLSLAGLAACGANPVTIATQSARSPDGAWLAVARTDRYSGPGNAGLFELVALIRLRGRRDTIQVLELEAPGPPPIEIQLGWQSATTLRIVYTQAAAVDLQTIRAAGINIAVCGPGAHPDPTCRDSIRQNGK